jgi:zinc transport system ATP-binding protein
MDARIPGDTVVKVSGAGVRRGDRWLVEGIDLSIRRGEIVTLIGPNGSGKSTTAKMVTGVLKPDAGVVERAPNLTIGYVPQKLNIDWTLPLTVRRLMTLTGRYPPTAVAAAMEAVGVAHLADEEVQHLSGGEFQRTLMARAMIRRPDLLVLDEPVQGVDFSGEVALYDLIKQIRDETQCGVLLISHDLHVVMAETDTVICLNGHICCQGSPQSVARSPEYLELFGARAAATLAIYQHHHDHTHLPDGSVREADGTLVSAAAHFHRREHEHDHEHGHEHEGHRHG